MLEYIDFLYNLTFNKFPAVVTWNKHFIQTDQSFYSETNVHCLNSEVSHYYYKVVVIAKSRSEHTQSSSIIQVVDTEDQDSCLAF